EAARNTEMRIARHGANSGSAVHSAIAGDPVDQAGRSQRGRNDGDSVVLCQRGVDAFGAGGAQTAGARVAVALIGARTFGFRFDHEVVFEVGHFQGSVLFVELDDVFEGTHGEGGRGLLQVVVEVGLEIVEEDFSHVGAKGTGG